MAASISESGWKAFTKKQQLELDDKEFLKALAKFDKTDIGKPESRMQALDEVIEQGKKQVLALAKKKKDIEAKLGGKTFDATKDELNDVIEAAEKLLKEAREALQQAQADQEEADSPALLTSKMLPLIRELRKGEATMYSLVALAGKETIVLISRRSISPARGKLLKEQMSNPSGLKFIRGECLFEQNALTFVVQAPAAGLAKKLKAALLAQTELRLKVRVRGEDPDDVEEDLEEDGGGDGVGSDGGQAGAGVQSTTAPPGGPATPEQAAYAQRLRLLQDRWQAALRAQHPEASKLRAVMTFATEKAEAKDYAGAMKALDMLQKLLDAPAGGERGPQGPQGVDAEAAFKARMTALIPKIKQAQADAHPSALDAKLKASQAGVLANKKDFQQAGALLDEVEDLLVVKVAGGNTSAGTWNTRLAATQPTLKAAIGTPGPQAAAIGKLLAQAIALSKPGGDMATALEKLEEAYAMASTLVAERLPEDADADLDGPIDVVALATAPPPPAGPGPVALGKARLEWDSARKTVQAELRKLEQAILAAVQDEPDVDEIRAAAPDLYDVLDVLDESLIGVLDALMNAEDPAQRYTLRRQAVDKLDAYADYVASDPLVQEVDGNPFLKVKVRSTLESTLSKLRATLG